MKRQIFLRALVGAPIGVAVSHLITVAVSLALGEGVYYPVVPELAAACGGELRAVLAQTACSLLYGAVWGAAAGIWELDWGLLRMTAVHLVLCSAATFPAAWLMRWMPHSPAGVIGYFALFFAVYAAIWAVQYTAMRRRVAELNKRVGEQ